MDNFKNIVEYISIVMASGVIVLTAYRIINIYQQSHYRLSDMVLMLKFHYVRCGWLLMPLIIFVLFGFWYIQLIYIVYAIFVLCLYAFDKPILPLKVTARIRRLLFTLLFTATISATLLHYYIALPQLTSSLAILHILLPFLIIICSFITAPLEHLIRLYYLFRAGNKLKRYRTAVIGITGSYGKTSTKNILYSFLKHSEITLATDASYNTLNGVSKNINEKLYPEYRYFIAEMGASHRGDIKKLCNVLKPTFGIVTAVGPQHLRTFKSMKNIIEEKMRLINSLPEDGIGIINADDENIMQYRTVTSAKIITFGVKNHADYEATDVKLTEEGLSFNIKFSGGTQEIRTNLLGRHNVYNILAAFALAVELGIAPGEAAFQAAGLEPVKNRLSTVNVGDLTIFEDAFNSNYVGFINALEILSKAKRPRILITPGIVETGALEKDINAALSEKIAEVCDFVIFVKSRSAAIIQKSLEAVRYENYVTIPKFAEAMAYVKGNYSTATVLIENDITDIYKI